MLGQTWHLPLLSSGARECWTHVWHYLSINKIHHIKLKTCSHSLQPRGKSLLGKGIFFLKKNIFQTLKIVHHSPEFLPYVIFLSAPSPSCLKQLGSDKNNEADNDFLSSVSKELQVYIYLQAAGLHLFFRRLRSKML